MQFAVEHGASDLHIQAGAPPMLRIAGQPRFLEGPALTGEETRQYISSIVPQRHTDHLDAAIVGGIDFSHTIGGLARFRCSAFSHLGTPAMVIRVIRSKIPSIEELGLPPVIREIALSPRGLTLLTGTTGSRKSTTLAALIEWINSDPRFKISN